MSLVTLGLSEEIIDMSLREYCEQTSLHGWFYIISADKRLWKTLWSLVSEWSGSESAFVSR